MAWGKRDELSSGAGWVVLIAGICLFVFVWNVDLPPPREELTRCTGVVIEKTTKEEKPFRRQAINVGWLLIESEGKQAWYRTKGYVSHLFFETRRGDQVDALVDGHIVMVFSRNGSSVFTYDDYWDSLQKSKYIDLFLMAGCTCFGAGIILSARRRRKRKAQAGEK